MIDPTTHRPRGFGCVITPAPACCCQARQRAVSLRDTTLLPVLPYRFVTYDDEQCVHRVFSAGAMHVVSGKQVEVKAATPKGSGPQASAYRTPPPGAMPMPAMGGPVMQQRVQQGRAGAQGTAGGPGMSGRTTGGYQAAQQTPYPMPGYPMAPGYGFPGMSELRSTCRMRSRASSHSCSLVCDQVRDQVCFFVPVSLQCFPDSMATPMACQHTHQARTPRQPA